MYLYIVLTSDLSKIENVQKQHLFVMYHLLLPDCVKNTGGLHVVHD